MCLSKASAMSMTPMRMRKESASILMVGWRSTKSLMYLEKASMTPTAIMTAVIMMLLHHADRGDDRVERKDDVHDHDLDHDRQQRSGGAAGAVLIFRGFEL